MGSSPDPPTDTSSPSASLIGGCIEIVGPVERREVSVVAPAMNVDSGSLLEVEMPVGQMSDLVGLTAAAIKAGRRVDHATVQRTIGVASTERGPTLVHERRVGATLDQLSARAGPAISGSAVRSYALDLLDGVAAIHVAGEVHGALDRASVVIGPDGASIRGLGRYRLRPWTASNGPPIVPTVDDDLAAVALRLHELIDVAEVGEELDDVRLAAEGLERGTWTSAAAARALIDRPDLPRPPADRFLSPIGWIVVAILLLGAAAGTSWAFRDADVGRARDVAVPSIEGEHRAVAEARLLAVGLRPKVQVKEGDPAPRGVVVGQEPAAGTEAPSGSGVAVIVSPGPEPVRAPDVAGVGLDDAEALLRALGFDVAVETMPSSAPRDTVILQVPIPTVRVDPGATITLTIPG